jgi:DNA/RNA-binding protein KIN17
MPRAEKGSLKDIANRSKAKGLQKLRFYCQMCQKQCRDENGFKCHLTSETHLRQMKIFQENSSTIMDQFSKDFESSYLDNLRRRHSTKKVNANNVYQEVIREKHHVHMNSTCWANLSDFVQYLGKTGKCGVEETERGWYVQYIDRDPAMLKRQQQTQRKAEAEREQEMRLQKRMDEMRREAAKKDGGAAMVQQATELDKSALGTTKISLTAPSSTKRQQHPSSSSVVRPLASNVFGDDSDGEGEGEGNNRQSQNVGTGASQQTLPREGTSNKNLCASDTKRKRRGDDNDTTKHSTKDNNNKTDTKRSKYEERQREDDSPKTSSSLIRLEDKRKKYWLHMDIIVRVITKKLDNGVYYKRKGVVTKLVDKYTAQVEILDSGPGPDKQDGGDILQLDQEDLETVVPQSEGKRVLIVNGRGRGHVAIVSRLESKKHRADLTLEDTGQEVNKVDYEDFSKLA